MPTLGFDADYSDSVEFASGSGNDTQYAIKVTAPVAGRITRLGGWVRGYSGDTSVRFCLWGTGNALKVKSEAVTIDSAASSPSSGIRYIADATTEFIMTEGEEYYLGVSRAPSGGMQIPRLDNGADHYEDNAGSIAASFNATLHNNAGRMGFFAIYEELTPQIKVYRDADLGGPVGADWELADVRIRRSGAWVDADAIKVYIDSGPSAGWYAIEDSVGYAEE